MSNKDIQNIDQGNVILANAKFDDDTLTFGADETIAEGTILARNTASANLVPFEVGGTGGNEIPVAILTYEKSGNSENLPARVLTAGEVREERLIIHADGDGSNITKAILDQLRQISIIPQNVRDLSKLDNQ